MDKTWKSYTEKQVEELNIINNKYKKCLDLGKTERECVNITVSMATREGYRPLEEVISEGKPLVAGDKVYAIGMNKAIALFHIGAEELSKGMNILGAHIDSPRVDLKQNPLYESDGLAYLDTHYYGGIKKYQWVATPMSLHGVVVKKDGTKIEICIGEKDTDPVFAFTDLLIHLSADQLTKKANVVIEGEKLDLLIGNQPLVGSGDDEKEAVKANILKLLEAKYGIEEADFLSAEIEIVPAGKARDCGLDRSMIMGYGHDDRVCAFPSLFALLDMKNVKRTSCCILVDKEEIGSTGATGMHSRFFENVVAELVALSEGESPLLVRRALANSVALSSDVSAGFDPAFPEVFEKKNTAFIGRGMSLNKYTGARGKNTTNDANPEFVAKLRRIFDEADVAYQFAELGKVDAGGGGTIAYILAQYGMEVIDSGVAVLCMHAPYEICSKADIYEAYKGYKTFLEKA